MRYLLFELESEVALGTKQVEMEQFLCQKCHDHYFKFTVRSCGDIPGHNDQIRYPDDFGDLP